MEHKTFPAFQLKIDGDQGIVTHIVAVFGNIDLGADVIQPGAFAKTITERGRKIKVVDSHNYNSTLSAIGVPRSLREIGHDELPANLLMAFPDATGALLAETQFLLNTPEGKGVFDRIKAGAIDEYSIGYDALDFDYSKASVNGKEITVRNLRTIKLYEYSPVLFAMNEATGTLGVKGKQKGDQPEEGKPWDIFKTGPDATPYCVYKVDEEGNSTGESLGCHATEEEARQQVEALFANEGKAISFREALQQEQNERDLWERHWQLEGASNDSIISIIRDEAVTDKATAIRESLGQFAEAMAAWYVEAINAGFYNEIMGKGDTAIKAGRVLAARNAERILSAVRALTDALNDAGITLEEPSNQEESSDEEPKDANQAGPDGEPTPPTKEEDLLNLINLHELEISILEV
jgi:hypothetical protein